MSIILKHIMMRQLHQTLFIPIHDTTPLDHSANKEFTIYYNVFSQNIQGVFWNKK